jgi:zinc transport system substrate-binding protein
MKKLSSILAAALLAAGCSSEDGEPRTIVASIYPLAFAAERIAGPGWEVIDLTPPGVEAHDLDLTLEQRTAIDDADLVIYLGDIGFQPQVESAVAEAPGKVIKVPNISSIAPGGQGDPHFWLLPQLMGTAVLDLQLEISRASEDADAAFDRGQDLFVDVGNLGDRYAETLRDCAFDTLIVSHEAFGYLVGPFEFEQFGLSALTPESAPTAMRLTEARELIDAGKAGAVFYEEHADAAGIAESFAADVGVSALPLNTLESRPVEGDYFTVMEDNLKSLREGLGCP